jgi:ADP-heptose:LPS heptosyltransferase
MAAPPPGIAWRVPPWSQLVTARIRRYFKYQTGRLMGRLPPAVFVRLRWPLAFTRPWRRQHLSISSRARGLGDELMCSAVFRAVKQANPGCSITFYARHPSLHEGNPDVFRVLPETAAVNDPGCIILQYDWVVPPPSDRRLLDLLGMSLGLDKVPAVLHDPRPRMTTREVQSEEKGYVCIQPKASGWTENKQWPEEHWTALVGKLLSKGVRVVEVGDSPLGLPFQTQEGFVSLAGQTSLDDYIATIGRAAVFAGPPSSGMHLAHAMKVPAVILFGGYETPLGHDYGLQTGLFTSLPCSPCWLRTACPYERLCLKMILPDAVCEAIFKILPCYKPHMTAPSEECKAAKYFPPPVSASS